MNNIILILGIIFSIVSLATFLFKDKFIILTWFLIANVIILIQYLLTDCIVECLIVAASIIKTVVFMIYAKLQIKPNLYVVIIFEVLMLVCGIIVWSSWFSLLFLIASMISTYASWQDDLLLMKILYAISSVFYIINYICTGLYTNIIAEVGIMLSAIIGIIIYDVNKRKTKV